MSMLSRAGLLCGLAVLAPWGALFAAEQSLGRLIAVDGNSVTVAFDAAAQIQPGIVLAVYAPGKVQHHPLTNEIIVEERTLVAKLQVVDMRDAIAATRLAWQVEGVALAPGFDCVPLPATAAPNAVPVASATKSLSVVAGERLELTVPLSDPDGDPLHVSWSIAKDQGNSGYLLATETSGPRTHFLAPLTVGPVTVIAEARDPHGQTVRSTQVIEVTAGVDPRTRSIQSMGDVSASRHLRMVQRQTDGTWLGHDTVDRTMLRFDAGWQSATVISPAREEAPGDITELVAAHGMIHCLDASSRTVQVYDQTGKRKRSYGELLRPTDLAVATDGVSYVADQSAGGILVFEADGQFRLRLGREGKSKDAFTRLTRIDLKLDGTIAALDADSRQIQRFDRFHRRLPTWTLNGDAANPIDIAWHPQGLLVLLADGRILVVNAEGLAKEAFAALSEKSWDIEAGAPDTLAVDGGGRIYTCCARNGVLIRRDANGIIDGVRAASVTARATLFRQDGRGRVFAIQPRDRMIRIIDAAGFQTARLADIAKDVSDAVVTPDGTALFVLDTDAGNVRRFDPSEPGQKPTVISARGKNDGQLYKPSTLATDTAGRVYVLDIGLRRIAIFDRDGRFLFNVSGASKGPSVLDTPNRIAVAPAGDALYVYDRNTIEVKKFTLDQNTKSGVFQAIMGGKGDAPGQLRDVSGLACDRLGYLYVCDPRRQDVQLVDFTGSNPVVLQVWKWEKAFKQRSISSFDAGPDASVLTGYDGAVTRYRW